MSLNGFRFAPKLIGHCPTYQIQQCVKCYGSKYGVWRFAFKKNVKEQKQHKVLLFERKFQLGGLRIGLLIIRTDSKAKRPRCTVSSMFTVSWYRDWQITTLTNTKCAGLNVHRTMRGSKVPNINKNLAIANRSRVSCAHTTSRASIGLITDDLEI